MVQVAGLGIPPAVLLATITVPVVCGEVMVAAIYMDQATTAVGGGNLQPAVGGMALDNMQTVDNQLSQQVTPSLTNNQVGESEKPFSFTRRQLILISVVGGFVLLFIFGLGVRAGERRVLRKQIKPQNQPTLTFPTALPTALYTIYTIPQGLEPSEFCKSYVAVAIPNPAEVKKQSIEFKIKNIGTVPISGVSIEVLGNVTRGKYADLGQGELGSKVQIGGVRLPENPSGEFVISGIDLYKNATLDSGKTLDALIPIEASGIFLLEIEQIKVIPSAIYQNSTVMCPDSQTTQSGGKYNYERDKPLN